LKKTFDMPEKKDFEAWMAKNKFQPWMWANAYLFE
jgi:hypothetical protein